MNEVINPDLKWYAAESERRGRPTPRCPFASVHRCPRYYESLSLLGEAGSTKIDPDEDQKLLERWQTSDLWPVTREQATSVMGPEGDPHIFSNFCPEVAFERFGLFVSFLARHADEIDTDLVHRRLGREGASASDWRWAWASVHPMHYTDCPLFAPLMVGGPGVQHQRRAGFVAPPKQPE